MPTEYECLLICSMSSYNETCILEKLNNEEKKKNEEYTGILHSFGWEPLSTSEKLCVDKDKQHGYFGVCYYKYADDGNSVEVVIAHRGTCFHEVGNILADISIAERTESAILREAAFEYVRKLFDGNDLYGKKASLEKCKIKGVPIEKITHTGFSLGGFIAGACVALTKYPKQAITFDAPGVGYLAHDKTLENKIINYVTVPNIVNTCNRHLGDVRQIEGFVQDESEKSKEIQFNVNFGDLGLSYKSSLSDHRITSEKYFHDMQEKKKKGKWLDSTLTELQVIMNSHNLNKIIEIASRNLWYRTVHLWPCARIKIIYGPHTEFFKPPKSIESYWSFFEAVVQIFKDSGFLMLWGKTEKVDERGGTVGVVGMEYQRTNKVYYSEQELRDDQRNILISLILFVVFWVIEKAKKLQPNKKKDESQIEILNQSLESFPTSSSLRSVPQEVEASYSVTPKDSAQNSEQSGSVVTLTPDYLRKTCKRKSANKSKNIAFHEIEAGERSYGKAKRRDYR